MMASSEDSPFASHMGTNYVPPDTEVLKIHEYLKDPKKEKAKLDDEIAEIQSTLDALKAKSDAIGATVKAHEALISPIRRYPDILQEIFVHCLPTDHDAVMSASEAPLLLTRVCSDWRRLALATPFLWSSLFVTLPGPPLRIFDEDSEIERRRAERFLRRLKTIATAAGEWLGRSGGCPLSISMVADSAQMPDGHSENPFVDVIVLFSSRWKRLIMQVHDGRSIAKILQVAATETPLLQELVLNTGVFPSTPGSQPSVKWALCGLVQAPRLQKLVFCNLTEDFSLFRLPWAQLTHISIDACRRHYTAALSPQKIFDIMERAACLVSAQFEVGNFDWPPPDAPGAVDFTVHGNTPLVLPSLCHLSIHAGSDPSHLFQALRTPNLREFGFFSTRLPGEGIPEVLLFISRAEHLTSFSTDPRCFTANEILECLRLCSSITCLKFGLGFVPHIFDRHSSFMPRGPPALTDDDLMQHLTPSEDPSTSHLCPTLKEFRCTLKACFSEEALTRFVTARQDLAAKGGLSKLERVIVAFAHIREMDAMKELESYVKSGLDLRVSYPLRLEASLSMRAGLEKILHFTDEGLSAMEHTLDRRLF